MLYLKEDNVEAFFTLLGTELHTFGPIYLSECFPKETVLNLGIVKSWLRSSYLIAGCSKRVLMYVGHMLFLTLYMRIAMSCSCLFRSLRSDFKSKFYREHTISAYEISEEFHMRSQYKKIGKTVWMQRSTQCVNITDWFLLPDPNQRDAVARRHLKCEIKQNWNAGMALRQRADIL